MRFLLVAVSDRWRAWFYSKSTSQNRMARGRCESVRCYYLVTWHRLQTCGRPSVAEVIILGTFACGGVWACFHFSKLNIILWERTLVIMLIVPTETNSLSSWVPNRLDNDNFCRIILIIMDFQKYHCDRELNLLDIYFDASGFIASGNCRFISLLTWVTAVTNAGTQLPSPRTPAWTSHVRLAAGEGLCTGLRVWSLRAVIKQAEFRRSMDTHGEMRWPHYRGPSLIYV